MIAWPGIWYLANILSFMWQKGPSKQIEFLNNISQQKQCLFFERIKNQILIFLLSFLLFFAKQLFSSCVCSKSLENASTMNSISKYIYVFLSEVLLYFIFGPSEGQGDRTGRKLILQLRLCQFSFNKSFLIKQLLMHFHTLRIN